MTCVLRDGKLVWEKYRSWNLRWKRSLMKRRRMTRKRNLWIPSRLPTDFSVGEEVLMRSLTLLALSAVLFISIGCTYQRQAKFIESEYKPYRERGTAVIRGQAFLTTRGGDVKYGAGKIVYLNPVTSYSKEWFKIRVLKGRRISPPDSKEAYYKRDTRADAEGRFIFKDLPAGRYYIACEITWEVPSSYGNIYPTGGVAYAEIEVKKGEAVDVVVSR